MFRASVRGVVEREIKPHVGEWEAAGAVLRSLFALLGEQGSEVMREIIARKSGLVPARAER